MGVSAVIRGGFGFLLDRHHDVHVSTNNNINVTPTNALHSFFRRQREAPLPITPVSILKSMLQLDDLQALLWAWTIVAILLLFAFWTNPNEASFRPFLTDLVFRQRLRLLNEDDDAALAQSSSSQHPPAAPRSDSRPHSSLLATASGSSAPFALTFGSKLALSVRTPPFHRKDLGLLSIVTISQSTPISTSTPQPTNADAAIDCTSLFIGAFGKWWVLGFAIPDLPGARSRSPHPTDKPDREELEENITDLADWGVLEMRAIDSESDSHHTLTHPNNTPSAQDPPKNHQPRTTPPVQPPAPVVHPSHPAQKDLVDRDTLENEDCLSITSLVARSRSEVADLHDQLAQVRSASTRACQALEHDLDQVRSKKKEEERLRSDVKTRTKALDDSKRQVESARREAERRLKAANAARALKQASIQQGRSRSNPQEASRQPRRKEGHQRRKAPATFRRAFPAHQPGKIQHRHASCRHPESAAGARRGPQPTSAREAQRSPRPRTRLFAGRCAPRHACTLLVARIGAESTRQAGRHLCSTRRHARSTRRHPRPHGRALARRQPVLPIAPRRRVRHLDQQAPDGSHRWIR